jgi:hypothetical protein
MPNHCELPPTLAELQKSFIRFIISRSFIILIMSSAYKNAIVQFIEHVIYDARHGCRIKSKSDRISLLNQLFGSNCTESNQKQVKVHDFFDLCYDLIPHDFGRNLNKKNPHNLTVKSDQLRWAGISGIHLHNPF